MKKKKTKKEKSRKEKKGSHPFIPAIKNNFNSLSLTL